MWWETEQGRKRLAVEKALMLQTYSDAKLLLSRGKLYWIIKADNIKIGLKRRGSSTIKVVYPHSDYPSVAPRAYVLDPHVSGAPHQYNSSGGNLCLFNPDEGRNYGWNPGNSTAVTIALWAFEWLKAYYVWKKTGDWPGDQEFVRRRE